MRLTRFEHPFPSVSLYGAVRWNYPGEDGIHMFSWREYLEPPIRQAQLRRPSVDRRTRSIRFWSDTPQCDGPDWSIGGGPRN